MRFLPIILGLILVFQSCKKDGIPENPVRSSCYFKVVHASSSFSGFDAYLEYYNATNPMGDSITFGDANPFDGYVKVTTSDTPSELGNGTLYVFGNAPGTSILKTPKSIFSLVDGQKKSLWMVDSAGKQVWYESVDQVQVDSTHAQVRFANWNFGSDFKLTSNGYDSGLLSFANISAFATLTPGKYKFSLIDAGGIEVAASDSIQLSGLKTYSFFVSGNQLKYVK